MTAAVAPKSFAGCPECNEMVQSQATYCPNCEHRFDSAVPDLSSPSWLQIAGLIVYLVLATPLMALGDLPATAPEWVAAVMVPAIVSAIVGTINWAAVARKRGRSWEHATVSAGPLAVCLLLALMSAFGQVVSAMPAA